ncbi:MAG: hypothetical protein ACOY3P_01615 [Planctomycetota bacterium]
MPTDLEQIAAIKAQTLARIVELTQQPKPSYQVDGQQVDWASYLARLEQTVDWCDRKLEQSRPVELHSRAMT